VEAAISGEFDLAPGAGVSSRQVQDLAEENLGDRPLADSLAAMMQLGAYTPRPDHDIGLGEKDPAEESDRLVRPLLASDGERGNSGME
jgi:hypothetical protein